MDNKTNITWPGWETVRVIGRGSFGTVYEIQRDIFGDIEKAALKHIPIPSSEEEIANFQNAGMDRERIIRNFRGQLNEIVKEYKLMRKLSDCPYVVNCDDLLYFERENGVGWDILMKMELLTPLTKVLRTRKEITEEEVIALGMDISRALLPCEKHNILHRDIKVQNIFVASDGRYKLGDFGIAKAKEKTGTDTARIGTYDYMAPEVYFGRHYDIRADIYSLGIVLYWMLNNRRMPFMPQTKELPRLQEREEARMRRLKGAELPMPVNGDPELNRIVLKCCAYQPEERYTTAAELIADLTAYQKKAHNADNGPTADDGTTDEPTTEADRGIHALLVRPSTGEVFPIRRDITLLGRKPEFADLAIEGNHAISREHAALVKRDSQYLLHNMRPKSGTAVNGQKLDWDRDAELAPCAEIMLADEAFLFLYGDACSTALREKTISLLRSVETDEIRLLTGEKLELNRNHKWRENVLGDRHVSREGHAEICRENGRYVLRHLNAPNGTFCNGRRLEPGESAELHNGDIVSVAETKFVYTELSLT